MYTFTVSDVVYADQTPAFFASEVFKVSGKLLYIMQLHGRQAMLMWVITMYFLTEYSSWLILFSCIIKMEGNFFLSDLQEEKDSTED